MSDYPSNLSDPQWEAVRKCIPPSRPVGVTRQVSLRAVVNAIRYRHRSGCAWRLLPHDFPHWRTVYGYEQQWQGDGTWRRIEQSLRKLRVPVPGNFLTVHLQDNRSPLVTDAVANPL
jgi:putative transposase